MKAPRLEGLVQVLILITVAGMAGAASFTHVHDWTMRNAPAATPTWFGWANAVITELVPAAAGIEIRRRKRQRRPVTYPMAILIADAAISIAVQLSDARHTLAGGVAFALPVLAFLALTKLVLSRAGTPAAGTPATGTLTGPSADAGETLPPVPVPADRQAPGPEVPGGFRDLQPVPSGQLLISARMTAFAHQQATGHTITTAELAGRLGVPPALAESLLDHLDGTPPPVTNLNGTALTHGGDRP